VIGPDPADGAIRPLPRSYLYVPGDRPDMLAKATGLGSDALIVDLEDAVTPDRKGAARETTVAWLEGMNEPPTCEVWVRINANPQARSEDLRALSEPSGIAGIVVAKADPETIDYLAGYLPTSIRLQPLVETAGGVLRLREIATGARVERLQLGEADLSADLGVDFAAADEILSPIRLQVVVASSAVGVESPVAPVSTEIRDLDGSRRAP
jgi:citrate lyase subunit beta/citryl-CoA lyase